MGGSGSLGARAMAHSERAEDSLSPALFHASRGQDAPPETSFRGLRVTLDRPLRLRSLGLPICKMGMGNPASTEEASKEARDR